MEYSVYVNGKRRVHNSEIETRKIFFLGYAELIFHTTRFPPLTEDAIFYAYGVGCQQ